MNEASSKTSRRDSANLREWFKQLSEGMEELQKKKNTLFFRKGKELKSVFVGLYTAFFLDSPN